MPGGSHTPDRPGAYRDTTINPTVVGRQVAVTVRPWSDDPAWGQRIRRLLVTGLPALSEHIGLEWPDYDKPIVVSEAVSRSTGGYAGIFDPSAGDVAIAYYNEHDDAQTTMKWVREAGRKGHAIQGDLTSRDVCFEVVRQACRPINWRRSVRIFSPISRTLRP